MKPSSSINLSPARTLCVAGRNEIAVAVLEDALARDKWRLFAIPTADYERNQSWQPSFRDAAECMGVPVVDLGWAERENNLCFLSVEFDQLIRPDRFRSNRLFNIHFSLLPKFRGCLPGMWAILEGETHHGVTLHWIDRGMDTGPLIDQREFDISTMTSREIYLHCMQFGADLISKWLDRLVEGDLPVRTQNEDFASSYKRAAMDFSWSTLTPDLKVEQILRRVRAFYFPEFQTACLNGLSIVEARPTANPASRKPGTIEVVDEHWLRFWVADGAVDLKVARNQDVQ